MPEEFGTKELEEAVVGVLETGLVAFQEFKDGIDLRDFADIAGNDEWRNAMAEAVKGATAIPDEAKDLSTAEVTGNIVPLVTKWVEERLLPALGVGDNVVSGDGSGEALPEAD